MGPAGWRGLANEQHNRTVRPIRATAIYDHATIRHELFTSEPGSRAGTVIPPCQPLVDKPTVLLDHFDQVGLLSSHGNPSRSDHRLLAREEPALGRDDPGLPRPSAADRVAPSRQGEDVARPPGRPRDDARRAPPRRAGCV